MITAMANWKNNLLILTYDCPKGYAIAPESFSSEAEATRRVYYHNRKYITARLKSWLNQRIYAFRIVDDRSSTMIANELLLQLTIMDGLSLVRLCGWIVRNGDTMAMIAPREKSHHYKFYHDTILPIVAFSKEMEGIPA